MMTYEQVHIARRVLGLTKYGVLRRNSSKQYLADKNDLPHLDDMEQKGWITRNGRVLSLTANGRAQFRLQFGD